MTKRSRKSAFGKADVVRRSALKTIPVYARDPLALDSPALRKNVRITLVVGTALSASLMAAMVIDSQPAMAATVCTATVPLVEAPAGTFTSTGNQATGIECQSNLDPTVVVTGGDISGNSLNVTGTNDGSGIQIQDTRDGGSPANLTVNLQEQGGTIGQVGTAATNGIHVVITDNTLAGAAGATDFISITNAAAIGSATGTKNGPVTNAGIIGELHLTDTISSAIGSVTGPTASGITTISNTAAIYATNSGIIGTAEVDSSGTSTAGAGFTATGGAATAGVVINNTGGSIFSGAQDGISALSLATANGSGFYAFGGTASATTNIYNAVAITSNGWNGIYGRAQAYANGNGSDTAPGSGTGGIATAITTITNQGGSVTTFGLGIDGIYGGSKAHAFGQGYFAQGGTASATTSISNSGIIKSS